MHLKIHQDHARFRQIVKGRVRQELRRFIASGELIGREGDKTVSIPVPRIDIPRLKYGDRNQGGVARASAMLTLSDANSSATARRVEAEVRIALAEYRASYNAIIEDNEGLLQGAGEMRVGIREAYAAGAKSLVEVLDAEQAFSDAMRLEIEEEAGYVRTYHLLNAAVGRAVLSTEP